jgi:hypothetical protein
MLAILEGDRDMCCVHETGIPGADQKVEWWAEIIRLSTQSWERSPSRAAPAVEAWWARGLLLNPSNKLCHLRIVDLDMHPRRDETRFVVCTAQAGLLLLFFVCNLPSSSVHHKDVASQSGLIC